MRGENCLIVFNLGHLDNSVGGVLSDTGVQGPPLNLYSGHFFYLQEHSSFRVQEDCVC